MEKNIVFQSRKFIMGIVFISVVISVTLFANYYLIAWTEPAAAPPAGGGGGVIDWSAPHMVTATDNWNHIGNDTNNTASYKICFLTRQYIGGQGSCRVSDNGGGSWTLIASGYDGTFCAGYTACYASCDMQCYN